MKKKKGKIKKKFKEIKLEMKFNPGTMSYEPVLPVLLIKKTERGKWKKKKF